MIGMQAIIVVWIFVLGSCFGSFLNVVIYRLPAGMSLGKPKSRCPKCETQLAVRDNVPVIGWMWLRGKCRYCSQPIPARYPIVEALCGGIFLALLFGELLSGAANLPLRHPDHFSVHPGFWLVWFMKWDLSGLYVYHCCLLIVVLAVVMIGYDGHSPQRKLTTFGLTVGLVAAFFFNELRPVPAMLYPEFIRAANYGFWWHEPLSGFENRIYTGVSAVGLCDGLAGIVGGALAGRLVCWQMGGSLNGATSDTPMAAISTALLITGTFLGWQACGMLSVIVLPLLAVSKLLDRRAFAEDHVSSVSSETQLPGRASDTSENKSASPPTVGSEESGEFCVPRYFQRMAAPLFFVVLCAFVLNWKWLDDSAWMIGHAGWNFCEFAVWLEWLVTLFLVVSFASAVRRAFCAGESTT